MSRAVDSEQNEIGADLTEPSETIDHFCKIERMSRATYYKLQRAKLGPRVTEVVLPPEPGIKHGKGLHFIRISAQAHREWRAMIAQVRASEASGLEAARAHAQRVAAAKKSVASPKHISKRARPAQRCGRRR
jgi:hypothetical protein